MAIEIIRYTRQFADQVAELQTRLWNPDPEYNLAYLNWKHHDNPFTDQPLIFLAIDKGKVIGMRGFYGTQIEIGPSSEQFSVFIADDATIAREYESQGIFPLLMDAGLNEIRRLGHRFVFSFGAGPTTMLAQLATGWKATPPLQERQLEVAPQPFAVLLRERLKNAPYLWRHLHRITAREERHAFHAWDRSDRATAAKYLSFTDTPRIDDMVSLIARLGHDGRCRVVRDRKFFEWRFKNPLSTRRFIYWDNEELDGYLVLEKTLYPKHKGPLVKIVDIETKTPDIMAALIEPVCQQRAIPTVLAWARSLPHDADDILHRFGFTPHKPGRVLVNQRPCILTRNLVADNDSMILNGRDLQNLDDWDYRNLYGM